jgi:hypothetical protein
MQVASRHDESSRGVSALTLHDDASIALPLNSSLHSREKPGASQKEAVAAEEEKVAERAQPQANSKLERRAI